MHDPDVIAVQAAIHPNPTVARLGIGLDHQYVEWCWTPLLGPTGTVLLRRLNAFCLDSGRASRPVPALADELGLKPATVRRTVERLQNFGFLGRQVAGVRDLYATVAPLTSRQLDKLPATVRDAHNRFVNELLAPAPLRTTQRLDLLERRSSGVGVHRSAE